MISSLFPKTFDRSNVRRPRGPAAALILSCCALLSCPAAAQVAGGSCTTLNQVYSPLQRGNPTNTAVICDGSQLQNLWSATASPLSIDFLGSVGIGSMSPGKTLDVTGTIRDSTALITPVIQPNSDSTSAVQIQTTGGGEIVDVDTTNSRVGILAGSAPLSTLDVGGDINVSGGSTNTKHYYGSNFGLVAGYSSPVSGRVMIGDGSGWKFNFSYGTAASPTDVMTIKDTGNVGIGSTSPAVSLDISQKTDAVALPAGTISQRPTPVNGMIRYDNSGTPTLEAYINGSWTSLLTSTGSTSMLTLGTSATATNPQRSGDLTTGLFSAAMATISHAISGVDVGDFTAAGLNLLGTITQGSYSIGYKINGANAVWEDGSTNQNIAVGPTAFPTTNNPDGTGNDGQFNTAVGYQALNANTTGRGNTAVGTTALAVNTTGYANTAVGQNALSLNTTGFYNTAVGAGSAIKLTGSQNTVLGANALKVATGVMNNTGVGNAALGADTTGSNDTAFGSAALAAVTTGASNTAFGYNAGADVTTGAHNVFVGDYATAGVGITTGSNNIMIGQDVRPPSQTASNQMNIGNLIYATGLASGSTLSTGNVGIGAAAPHQSLEIDAASFPAIRIASAGSTTSYLELTDNSSTQLTLNKVTASGNALIDINPVSSDGSSGANARFFRTTNTTGAVSLQIMEGNNTANANTALSGNGNSYLNALTGNVGIGTTTPYSGLGTELDVNGAIYSEVTSGVGFLLNSTGAYGGCISNVNSTTWALGYGGSSPCTSVLNWNQSGQVGIGTTTPAEVLDVNGRVHIAQTTAPGTTTDKLYNVGGTLYWNAAPLGTSKSLITSAFPGTLAAQGSTHYFWPGASSITSATPESSSQVAMPAAGTLSNFFLTSAAAQSSTGSLVLTLRKNGASTALAVTIPASGAAGTYSDTTHTVSVSAGDLLDIQITNNATSSSTIVGFTMVLTW